MTIFANNRRGRILQGRLRLATTAAMLCVSTQALSATLSFTGTRENVTRPAAAGTGRCAPTFFRTITIEPGNLSSTGTSNFGAFSATMSHCETSAAAPLDILEGILTFDFEVGDSLFGTYTGRITAGQSAGVFDVLHNFVVTGGTGRFLDASGAITGIGTLRPGLVGGAPAGTYAGTLDGLLDLPAVPEPSTWVSLIVGFGAIGAALRRGRRQIQLA